MFIQHSKNKPPAKKSSKAAAEWGRKLLGTVSRNAMRDALVSRNDSAASAHIWTEFCCRP